MISWKDFWQWVQRNTEVARVVGTYENGLPNGDQRLTPSGAAVESPPSDQRPVTSHDKLRELMRYLYVRASFAARHPLHKDAGLDGLWHALILQTKTYRSVCDKLGAFIDHESGQFTDDPLWYSRFLGDYYDLFREAPDWNVWPAATAREVEADQTRRALRDHDCA